MSQPLAHKRILLTRPAHQTAGWQTLLQQAGAITDSIPMLAIQPLQDETSVQAIKHLVMDFDQFEHAIFVSQNAVQYGFDWLDNYWPQLPQGPHFYAIGAATARAINARGATVTACEGAMDSAALLALPQLQAVANQRLVIFRGQGGRTLIGDTLIERGARLDYCELYQRLLPPQASAQLAAYHHTPDAITVHSGETLQNLHQCVNNCGQQVLLNALLICPSARVARNAEALGFTRVAAAANAGDQAMRSALQQALTAANC